MFALCPGTAEQVKTVLCTKKGMINVKKKSGPVSCHEIQRNIKPYIMEELELAQAYAFAEHIRKCNVCREELEIYYAFSSALMQLNHTDEEDGNFNLNIEKRLERTEAAVAKAHKEHVMKRMLYVAIVFLIAAATGVSIGV